MYEKAIEELIFSINDDEKRDIKEYKEYTQAAYYYVNIALSVESLLIYFWRIKDEINAKNPLSSGGNYYGFIQQDD